MTDRSLILVALVAAVAFVTDLVVAFAVLESWGNLGSILINIVGFGSILTLLAVGAVMVQRWRMRAYRGSY